MVLKIYLAGGAVVDATVDTCTYETSNSKATFTWTNFPDQHNKLAYIDPTAIIALVVVHD